MLQIVDVASNNFSGNFPVKNFSTWKAMIDGEDEARSELNHLQFKVLRFGQFYYQDSVSVTLKGLDIELVKVLTIFTSIDVSCNSLAGPLPEEVGVLKSLYVLNLSHNAFTGQIPISLANLTHLESLDLSSNKLTGNIPMQLAESLNFLSVLNLSFNQLVGRIPNVKQFATFSNTSFEGNKGLCGFPLNATCAPNVRPPSAAPKSRHRSSSCADAKAEGEEDFEDDNIGDCDDENESEDGEFQGRYCVFCSKLDISRKRVIHDPRCLCHNSPTISSSSSTSSSSS
ncbi:Receptor-like protein 12 [Morella rubra]|uniref:Receptor-like protein 12 n=1 Tax=Morella rubra TaxID=262757 RepID=A0A6A1WNU8_9ROSI|nr:Receptor-like protein 12 [Morella rubra]